MNPIAVPLAISPTTGASPTNPATLRDLLDQAISAVNPDYTSILPGSLVEDLLSTGTGFMVSLDQARVDATNNINPASASPYILSQMGVLLGLPQGIPTNTSVLCVFSGPVGYVIPSGYLVSDGTYQYALQGGTTIGSNGTSPAVTCIATTPGSWTPLANTVTTILSSVPSGYTLTVNNPNAGTAGGLAESVQSYRSRLLGGSQVVAQGYAQFLQTLLEAIPGVVARLVSIQAVTNGWKIICGGGDSYQVGGAIYIGTLDLSTLQGSSTNANNVLVSLIVPPNVYPIVYVNPPLQVVTMTVTWNTDLPNFGSGPQVNQLAAPALQNAINSILVGQPINLLQLNAVFTQAVASVLPSLNISDLTYAVYINGTLTGPAAGTQLISGDSESYFSATATAITVQQG